MAWNYRKRIKILPGIHLNVSKKGVSTTFGVKGASITTSKRGTYLNTSIPGTGIYKRQKISGGRNESQNGLSFNSKCRKCRINVGNMSEMSDKVLYQASPAKFVISCSHSRTILQTARQENSSKPRTAKRQSVLLLCVSDCSGTPQPA